MTQGVGSTPGDASPVGVLAVLDRSPENDAISAMLRAEGFELLGASNSDEAMRVLSLGRNPITLCGRQVGRQSTLPLLERIRSGFPRVRRILLTPSGEDTELEQAVNAGVVQRLLIRPVEGSQILTALREQAALRRVVDRSDELSALAARKSRELQLAQRLLRLQRQAAVGQLAAGLAHEINNPLGTIMAFAQILIREKKLTGEDLEALQFIEQGAIRCKRVIDAVVRFSNQSSAPELRERIPLIEVARETLILMHKQLEGSGVATELVEGPSPDVLATFQQLQQLAQALLTNAMEATSGRPNGKVSMSVFSRGSLACLAIRDNGKGIDHALRDRIFEPFFTTKAEGEAAGLGLTTADHIAQLHGGMIEVDSEPEVGSTFTLVLPRFRDGDAEARRT